MTVHKGVVVFLHAPVVRRRPILRYHGLRTQIRGLRLSQTARGSGVPGDPLHGQNGTMGEWKIQADGGVETSKVGSTNDRQEVFGRYVGISHSG